MTDSALVLLEARFTGVAWRLANLEARPADRGPQGPAGPPGPQGRPGPQGDMPRHRWQGTSLQFTQGPDGSVWGELVDLQGPPGEVRVVGGGGGGFVPGVFSVGVSGLVPAPTTSDVAKFLAGDGTWRTPNSYMPAGW